ncbi:MAG: hypothetical protein FJW40_00880 [Acidobacteria bacterium]|nr:hypothetical protein [Acidobacteriota bacterium]
MHLRLLSLAIAFAGLLAAANIKLYLKDGEHHVVREYRVEGDRVRFYSIERADWEEIPSEIVDLKRTENEIQSRQDSVRATEKAEAEEAAAERAELKEIRSVPPETGAYWVDGATIKPLKQAESKLQNNKRRSILKAMTPIPVVNGKATVELDGEHSAFTITEPRPEFYIRLSEIERFAILRLKPGKGVRIVQELTIAPVVNMVTEEKQDLVETFRRQMGSELYKVWPTEPLPPGDYAVVEYTEGKINIQVWDFRIAGEGK